jgi:hypothetical protein
MLRRITTLGLTALSVWCYAQSLVDTRLTYDTVILDTSQNPMPLPIAIEFLSPDDPNRFFLLEKHTGRVRLVENGIITRTVLDLPVNTANWERGLLYITKHPDFQTNGYVYLFYSNDGTGTDTDVATNWTDNRLVRYRWNGTSLVEPQIILSIPFDSTQTRNGPIHNGGVMFFGPDGKLWLVVGELDRSNGIETNQNATRVIDGGGIIRINDDGSIPLDNPFVAHSDNRIRRLWAYGIRNSFGMTIDPLTGNLWMTENGPNVYDEINLVRRGFNSAWRRWMGPIARNSGANVNNLGGCSKIPFLTLSRPTQRKPHTNNHPHHPPHATTAPSSTTPTSPTPTPAHTPNNDTPHNSHTPPSHSQTPALSDTAPPTPTHTPPNAPTPAHALCPEPPDAPLLPHAPQAATQPAPHAPTTDPDTRTTCPPPTTPPNPPPHCHTAPTTALTTAPRPHTPDLTTPPPPTADPHANTPAPPPSDANEYAVAQPPDETAHKTAC